MINMRYRLKSPKQVVVDFCEENINDYELVVRPTYLSICKADQRYYQGQREKAILDKKLPLALIHEAIGKVVYSKNPAFKRGDSVVLIPNVPTEVNKTIKDNYLPSSKFRGSSQDGFMQSNILCNGKNVIKLDNDNPCMVFLELMSVVMNSLEQVEKTHNMSESKIAIWGDGSLGYITALILTKLYPSSKVIVIGKQQSKLDYFSFVQEKYLVNKIPKSLTYDYAFECVGNSNSESVVNTIIDQITPQGVISLLGVSEHPILVNTRMVLEKGLTILGSSRSNYDDFWKAVSFINQHPEVTNNLNNLISNLITVNNIKKIDEAFLLDCNNEFKTVMMWDV